MQSKKLKVLVTGGAGYIGSHVVKLLLEEGHHVWVYDNLSTGFRQAVGDAKLVHADLAQTQILRETLQEFRPDAVMHFAGSIVVPESVENPLKYYRNNTLNSLNLINACVDSGVQYFIFSSTAAVYGILENGVATERTPTAPINPYGESKLMTEHMLRDTALAHKNFHYAALRYFNVSGAALDGTIGQAFPGATHLIKVNCEAAVGKREQVFIFGDDFETADGTGVRDYIHVQDLAQAHLDSLDYLLQKNESQVFNCGYGHGYSVKQVMESVKEVTHADYPVQIVGRRAGDPAQLVADSSKLKQLTGWRPQYDDLKVIVRTAFEWEKSKTLKTWVEDKK